MAGKQQLLQNILVCGHSSVAGIQVYYVQHRWPSDLEKNDSESLCRAGANLNQDRGSNECICTLHM